MRLMVTLTEYWLNRVALSKINYFKYQQIPVQLLQSCRYKNTSSVLRILNANGIKEKDVQFFPKLLELSETELNERKKLLKDKITEKYEFLNVLLLPPKDIEKYLEIRKNKEKVRDLSIILKCSESESNCYFFKYTFLLRSKISTIKEKVDIMIENGVTLEDLKRDFWIMTYPKEQIRTRLETIKELNIHPIKPWMLRCQQHILFRAQSNKDENLQAMAPHTSTKEYLCSRLELSPSQFNSLISKYPAVANIQVSKLKEIIDFLLFEGFTPLQIYQVPRVLCHSVHTIKDRLLELRENDYQPPSLLILCKNKPLFESFVFKLKKKSIEEP